MSDITDKISKLLAMAEGTTNKDEANAYTEKAQKLATEYAVDLELARARQKTKTQREELTHRRIITGEPGRQFKNRWWVDLMLQVAEVNDLRCTISHDRSVVNAYGYPSDLDVAEMLYTSLNAQMIGGVALDLKTGVHKELGVHGATYRLNFYEAFISTIGSRLYRARREAMADQKMRDDAAAALFAPTLDNGDGLDLVAATEDTAAPVTGALVMVKKKEAVNDYYAASTRGTLSRASYRSIQPKTFSGAAQGRGATAANNASLGLGRGLPSAEKHALS